MRSPLHPHASEFAVNLRSHSRLCPLAACAALLAVLTPQWLLAQSADAAQLLKDGKFAEAREAYEQLLHADPANAQLQAAYVQASEQLTLQARAHGAADDALKTLLHARELVPNNARLLFDLGMIEEEMHLLFDADQALAQAEILAPTEPDVIYAVARVKMERGDLAAAQTRMEAYLKLRPTDASAHFGLGRVLQLGLQFEAARAEFLRSIELQPAQTESYYELGDLALKQGDFDEALTRFNKTLERDPHHGGALEGAGEASFKKKNYAQAQEFLRRAIEAAPNYAPSHYYLGLTLARLAQKEESARELDRANQLSEAEKKNSTNRIQQANPQP